MSTMNLIFNNIIRGDAESCMKFRCVKFLTAIIHSKQRGFPFSFSIPSHQVFAFSNKIKDACLDQMGNKIFIRHCFIQQTSITKYIPTPSLEYGIQYSQSTRWKKNEDQKRVTFNIFKILVNVESEIMPQGITYIKGSEI